MVAVEWRSRSDIEFNGNFKEYISKVRGINDINEYLNPSSSVVNSPLLLKNIRAATERVIIGVKNNENILVFADPDP